MKRASIPLAALVLTLLSPPPSALSAEAPKETETLAAILVNGNEVSDGTIVLHESDGTYAIPRDDAPDWDLALPANEDTPHQGKSYIPLRAFPSIRVLFNEDLQRLELTVPPVYFQKTDVNPTQQQTVKPMRDHGGLFLNYDTRLQEIGGSATGNAVFNSAMTLGRGIVNASFLGQVGDRLTGMRRVSTDWQTDDVAHHTTFRLGDSATNSGLLISTPQFLGFQLFSNYSTAPGLVITPQASVQGTAQTPSNANIYVDGKLYISQQLPTGPFQIENLPINQDTGNVQVLVTDAAGKQQLLTTAYYSAPNLLKRDIAQFSVGAGLQSSTSSTGAPHYGSALLEASDRYGFTDHFTGEADLQVGGAGSALSSGGIWAVRRVGIFDAAANVGNGTQPTGLRYDYTYQNRGVSFGAGQSTVMQNLQNTVLLAPGISAPTSISHSSHLSLGFPLSSRGSLSFSIINQNDNAGNATRTLSASGFLSLGHAQLNANIFRSSGTFGGTSALLSLNIPLNAHHRVGASVDRQSGSTLTDLTLQGDEAYVGGHATPGYQISLGSNPSGEISFPTEAAELSGGFSSANGSTNYQLEAVGSLTAADHRLLASQVIRQAYGIAVIPGYPHVRVYVNSQYVGRTDKRGAVALPNLQPYQKNTVSLEEKDLPVTANIDTLSKTVVPSYESPVVVRFPVRGNGGVIVHVKMSNGSYMLSGAMLSAGDSSWPVADEGEAYLDSLPAGPLKVTASGGDIHCGFTVLVPNNTASIPDLGEIICR